MALSILVAAALALPAFSTPLQVWLVPHSHDDLCWLKKMGPGHGSYYEEVKRIYDSVIAALSADQSLTFNFAEVGFVRMWWEDPATSDAQRTQFTRLLLTDPPQIEIVGGGYSQPDEALTDREALVANMMNGHLWLNATFGSRALPKVSWSLDPFGQTATAMELFSQMGFRAAVVDRIPEASKRELIAKKSLEFLWMPKGKGEPVLTHVLHHMLLEGELPVDMVYMGPEGFDFEGPELINPPTTASNLERRAHQLAELMRKRHAANSLRHGHLLLLWGNDFHFQKAEVQFQNMKPLVDYINAHAHELGVDVRFARVSEYFDALQSAQPDGGFPQLPASRDFVPYDGMSQIPLILHSYWNGFYFSHPSIKAAIRRTDATLHAAEAFAALSGNLSLVSALQFARDTSALMTHHDAIPGTSTASVMADLAEHLETSANLTRKVLASACSAMLQCGPLTTESSPLWRLLNGSEQRVIVVAVNSVGWINAEHISFEIPLEIAGRVRVVGGPVNSQQVTIRLDGTATIDFLANPLQALSLTRFEIEVVESGGAIVVYEEEIVHKGQGSCKDVFTVASDNIELAFSKGTGELCSYTNTSSNVTHEALFEYVAFRPFADGVYDFHVWSNRPSKKFIPGRSKIVRGPVKSMLVQEMQGDTMHLSCQFELPQGASGVLIKHQVGNETHPITEDTELAMRLSVPEIQSQGQFFSDTNGLYLQERHWTGHLAESIFPGVRRATVKDPRLESTVLLGHAQGVTSDDSGVLQLFLHRRMRLPPALIAGMQEPLNDKAPLQARHLWLLGPGGDEVTTWNLQARFEQPVELLFAAPSSCKPEARGLQTQLPASLMLELRGLLDGRAVVRLHGLATAQTSLRFHDQVLEEVSEWTSSLMHPAATPARWKWKQRDTDSYTDMHTGCALSPKEMGICVEEGRSRTFIGKLRRASLPIVLEETLFV